MIQLVSFSRTRTLKKEKGFTRENLGKAIGTSGAIIGRYERNEERTPSVEIARKLAQERIDNF